MEVVYFKMIKGDIVGEGAYGKVYLARESVNSPHSSITGARYVVKRNIVEKEVDWAANLREPDILLRLRGHPNIVKLERVIYGKPFESGRMSPTKEDYKDDKLHFVMEMGDLDLRDLIQNANERKETSYEDIKPIVVDVLLALEYMHHNQILHRDIKPGNILIFLKSRGSSRPSDALDSSTLNNDPDSSVTAKLCDFGLSKFYTKQEPQTPRMVTAWYRSPEIAMGAVNYDYKVDVWSLGCVIYEMLTGSALVVVSRDENKRVLEQILRNLPERLPPKETKKLKELFDVKLPRGRKKAFIKVLFPEETRESFREIVGSPEVFTELVRSMLEFYPDNRPTITQILDHEFFDDCRDKIDEVRGEWLKDGEYACFEPEEKLITIASSQERKWGVCMAFYFYNKNLEERLDWYKPRILFQAIDLFDRYLCYASDAERTPLRESEHLETSALQSEHLEDGLLKVQVQTEVKFIACVYLSIKYFATFVTPPSYLDMCKRLFSIEGTEEFARVFEKELLEKVFKYKVYRPTVFEYADLADDELSSNDIMNLLMAYGNCEDKENMELGDLYKELREFRHS